MTCGTGCLLFLIWTQTGVQSGLKAPAIGAAPFVPPSGSGRRQPAAGGGRKQQAADEGAHKKSKTSTSAQRGIVVKPEDCTHSGPGLASGGTHHHTLAQHQPDVKNSSWSTSLSTLTREPAPLAPPSGRGRQQPAAGSERKPPAVDGGAHKKSKTKGHTGQPDKSPKLCPHQRRKRQCKDCGGSAFCQHGRNKSRCKDCGGSALCEHQRIKNQCKDCGGSAFCQHGRNKSRCKDCGGSAFCEHQRIKSRCKDCGGSALCEHQRIKSQCKDCGGSGLCEHKRQRSRCKDCGGSGLCEPCLSFQKPRRTPS